MIYLHLIMSFLNENNFQIILNIHLYQFIHSNLY